MNTRKWMIKLCLTLLIIASWGVPARAVDESKIPHYFGPYSNWALSPLPGGAIATVTVTAPGSGYTNPVVTITDPSGTGATATAQVSAGSITGITINTAGSGYIHPTITITDNVTAPAVAGSGATATAAIGPPFTGGIRKFVDALPGLTVAVPDTTTYPGSDYYEIAVVQYRQKMHSDLPPTLLRGYVQLSTGVVPGAKVPLSNALLDGTTAPIAGYTGVAAPSYLGPVIVASKGKPVRVLFRNLLPNGAEGDLFLPVDSTFMGAGDVLMTAPYDPTPTVGGSVTDAVRNPMCNAYPKMSDCFPDNRATLHLHGGVTPWISDGTPHQWITPAPASPTGAWPKGVSVQNVPDMPDPGTGAMTFFYSNQQSARLMFYHDHSWGITRLNVYAGEAGGYLITDDTEKALVTSGVIPAAADTLPLVIQDRTFVPQGDKTTRTGQLYDLDPTWDESRWGGFGNLWYHHVYMPAQNPDDPSGLSAYGRWMYGPWFWPPARDAKYGPIANPYYNMDPKTNFTTPLLTPCSLDDPATWQYQTDPFCEPALIPGTPNISAGMEQFNDTPVVNGMAYPTVTVDPKPMRLRILNAANDRFFNLQWYQADAGGTEVVLKASEVAAAQGDPTIVPTPDTALSPVGPSWIQIGTEGGFLPAPAVIPNQVITWINDPTRFDFGNVDKHSLVLAPAERADVIVDFSRFAGKTLILYNDAPAAYPARVASYDYYTGAPDLYPVGAPGVLPGYGPNTRTVMQVKVNSTTPAPAFDLAKLQAAFAHHLDANGNPAGVFETGQHPIIVGQAAYNSAYGTTFRSASWCNAPGTTRNLCDGFARISDQGGDLFGFNTLFAPTVKMQIPIEPKAIHDEMNASTFDDFGRMQANLGVETVPATPGMQNINLMAYTFPPTEIIDSSKLPTGMSVTPISTADGTQIWKITHNGVDTHPIHFHLYDVQVLNRVTWDNIIMAPDANELGWKETLRVSPLEDTIVALRPVIPTAPFDLPNSVRLLSPMLPDGAPISLGTVLINLGVGIPPTNPLGQVVDIYNHPVNFGWEYVYHCHILSHEEMDMMRPVGVAVKPRTPTDVRAIIIGNGNNRRIDVAWTDASRNETGFVVQRAPVGTTSWTTIATLDSTTGPAVNGTITYTDQVRRDTTPYSYKVQAINMVGDPLTAGFPTVTAASDFSSTAVAVVAPAAPSNVVATLQTATSIRLTWTDNSNNETSFVIQRSVNGQAFAALATVGANVTTYVDAAVTAGSTYQYRVAAANATAVSPYAVSSSITVSVPAASSGVGVTAARAGANDRLTINWTDSANNETSYTVQWANNVNFTGASQTTLAANTTSFTTTSVSRGTNYYVRVRATNPIGNSAWTNAAPFPIRTP